MHILPMMTALPTSRFNEAGAWEPRMPRYDAGAAAGQSMLQ